MSAFNTDARGLLWLKLKSIIRKDFVPQFAQHANLNVSGQGLTESFASMFAVLSENNADAHALLDDFIRAQNNQQSTVLDIEKLVSELYKLRHFDWGGDYQNALDKFLVSRFVKTDDPSYEKLLSKFDTEINPAVRGYVLNSWYNYWSSVLIENIFKSHPFVLPAIGKIKSVDFFIQTLPFDLKVTYFPSEFLTKMRKEKGYPVEFTFLKQKAREARIHYDKDASPDVITHEIREKMRDSQNDVCLAALETLQTENKTILDESIKNPQNLTQWLYENQGEMRFGSENRIYLILVDANDFKNSWKLKRNINLLKPVITEYLDKFSLSEMMEKRITFTFKGKPGTFSALADTLFVVTK